MNQVFKIQGAIPKELEGGIAENGASISFISLPQGQGNMVTLIIPNGRSLGDFPKISVFFDVLKRTGKLYALQPNGKLGEKIA